MKKDVMASCRSAHVRFIWTLTGMRNLSGTTSLGRRPPGLAVRACLSPPVCGAPAALAHVASQLVVDRSIQKDLEAVFCLRKIGTTSRRNAAEYRTVLCVEQRCPLSHCATLRKFLPFSDEIDA